MSGCYLRAAGAVLTKRSASLLVLIGVLAVLLTGCGGGSQVTLKTLDQRIEAMAQQANEDYADSAARELEIRAELKLVQAKLENIEKQLAGK